MRSVYRSPSRSLLHQLFHPVQVMANRLEKRGLPPATGTAMVSLGTSSPIWRRFFWVAAGSFKVFVFMDLTFVARHPSGATPRPLPAAAFPFFLPLSHGSCRPTFAHEQRRLAMRRCEPPLLAGSDGSGELERVPPTVVAELTSCRGSGNSVRRRGPNGSISSGCLTKRDELFGTMAS